MTDRVQLGAAVRSRSWDWLFALKKRLNVDLQLVDDGHVALLAESPGSAVDPLLSGDSPAVRLAIATAIRTRTPQAASVDRLQTVIVPVTVDRVVNGALIVARPIVADQPVEGARSQLELVGFWLTNAIEAHLQSPPAAQGDLDRLSALCRLLEDVAVRRSDRDIVGTFIETLAVWHDLEGCGYVETLDEYVRDVALPGAEPARTPAAIARAVLPDLDEVTRLSRSDMDRLGFSAGEDVAVARVGDGEGSWLIAVTGAIESEDLQRLSLYIALLDQAIARSTQTRAAHVLASLSVRLMEDAANPEAQARLAIEELQAALGMTSAALTVTSRTGTPVLHVGSSFTAADLTAGSAAGKVVVIRHDPQHYAMAFVADWSAEHHVTQQEHQVIDVVAELLDAWVRRLVRQSPKIGDRRTTRRGFDDLLERFARDAVQGGIPVTAVIMSFGDTALRPELTQARVARLREHLRGGDLVGRLGDGDVAMLLHDTAAAQAEALVARMRHVLQRDGVPLAQMSIGMATRRPGDPATGALAQEARQRTRHGSDN